MALILETSRLILRPFDEQDVEAFSRYRSDPEVARYQGWEAPFSLEKAARFVAEMQVEQPGRPGGWYQLAIALKSSSLLIGDCAFTVLLEDSRQAEIGFTLAREHQGQGYAREAVEKLLEYLFTVLRLHRVRANCDPDNTSSGRLLQRVGMRHEGRFIESLWFKGAWVGEDWYAILDREWRTLHPQSD